MAITPFRDYFVRAACLPHSGAKMSGYYRIPLLFFVLAAAMGLFLRWQFVVPTPGVRYTYFLHGHSHVMFLGWVFNVLYLTFVEHHITETARHPFLKLFIVLQVLVAGMMISFPMQGYGAYSIVFTTLHTLVVLVFIPVFFHRIKNDHRISAWFARAALVFFFISTAGPFALGYFMSAHAGQTDWFNFSIYYYLHFQYNGFFLFGVLSMFFQLLEQKKIAFSRTRALSFGKWTAYACVPAYALSILFARPALTFNAIGALAAIAQLAALIPFVRELQRVGKTLRSALNRRTVQIFQLALLAFLLKSLLQLASAHPDVATFAYSHRPIVIAYLHLVLVGIISFFLLGWYLEKNLTKQSAGGRAFGFLFTGFVVSEFCLIFPPSWITFVGGVDAVAIAIFCVSILMFIGAVLFYTSSTQVISIANRQADTDKSQSGL